MSNPAATRRPDDASPRAEESLLLRDLEVLVALGLVEERPSPDGPLYALTTFGRDVPPFSDGV
ncbi:MAG TPA: hypothetical protein VNS09_15400 [Solirubrobacter sp.]|nr:hypothetical protein [Solirubrobacter sp.]